MRFATLGAWPLFRRRSSVNSFENLASEKTFGTEDAIRRPSLAREISNLKHSAGTTPSETMFRGYGIKARNPRPAASQSTRAGGLITDRIATAAWMLPEIVERKHVYRQGSIWLGRSIENRVPIGYADDRHVCLVSGSRGGKGTTSIINNLCLWPGSLVVIDPKGENATVTVPRRGKGAPFCEGLQQAVHVLRSFQCRAVVDPKVIAVASNPLDALDPKNEETIDDAGRIADAIVVLHEESKEPIWDEEARYLIKGLVLHVLTSPGFEGRRNLITLRELITRGDWRGVDELRRAGEEHIPSAHQLLWTQMALNPAFNGLIAGIGDTFFNLQADAPKYLLSVLEVANRNTEFIDSPAMQRSLAKSDFQLSSLKTDPKGMSLYLCLPQRFMNTHYRWLRMLVGLTVMQMEIVPGNPATGYPVLMMLDEFAGLKRMEIIENAVAQLAGFGVKMFFVLQSLEQLKAAYKDKWETFLANCGLRVFFNLEDHFSREYFSKFIGDTELRLEVRSQSDALTKSHGISEGTSETVSETKGRSHSEGKSTTDGTNTSSGWSDTHGESGSQSETFTIGPNGSPSWATSTSSGSSSSHSTSGSAGSSIALLRRQRTALQRARLPARVKIPGEPRELHAPKRPARTKRSNADGLFHRTKSGNFAPASMRSPPPFIRASPLPWSRASPRWSCGGPIITKTLSASAISHRTRHIRIAHLRWIGWSLKNLKNTPASSTTIWCGCFRPHLEKS